MEGDSGLGPGRLGGQREQLRTKRSKGRGQGSQGPEASGAGRHRVDGR